MLSGWWLTVSSQGKGILSSMVGGGVYLHRPRLLRLCFSRGLQSAPTAEKPEPGLWLSGGPACLPPAWHPDTNVIKWPSHRPLQKPLPCLPASVLGPSCLVLFLPFYDVTTLLWELVVYSFPHMYNVFIFTIYLFIYYCEVLDIMNRAAGQTHSICQGYRLVGAKLSRYTICAYSVLLGNDL